MRTIDQIEFRGLIGNIRFQAITEAEFRNALGKCGWREAHNGHIYKRLCERGPRFGILTPNDFARALRDGQTRMAGGGGKARVCCQGQCWVIFREEDCSLITIRDARD
jgi:hypothetical protein